MHLCVACSMCCDGTLFARLTIEPGEESAFGPNALFFDHGEGRRMRLGCTMLGADGACGCYETRPKNCRTYRCELLRGLESGEVSDERAKKIVAEAKAMRETLYAATARLGENNEPAAESISDCRKTISKARKNNAPAYDVREARVRYDQFVGFVRAYFRRSYRKSSSK